MYSEVHAIPPAPRHSIRWSSALWHRWPLALGAFVLAIYGGLWTLMLFFASSGKPRDDDRLDAAAVRIEGRAELVSDSGARFDGEPFERVTFAFDHAGEVHRGESFAPRGLRPGGPATIEFLPEDPHVSRVADGRISLLDDFVTPTFWLTVIPGLCLALAWLANAWRTHRLLVHGDVAIARVERVRRLRFVVPSMLVVEFRFRDRHAILRQGTHWVREHSVLGQRLLGHPATLAVVHDRERPERHRLVSADEF